jgi:hypothetical protein
MYDIWYSFSPTERIILGLVLGFAFSLGVGGVVVPCVKSCLKRKLPEYTEERDSERIPPWLTGLIEKLAFTLFVILQPVVALPAMMAWLALKMAANWNKSVPTRSDPEKNRTAARFEMLT